MTNIPNWLIWLGAVGAGLTALFLIWKVVISFVRAFSKIDSLVQVIDPVIAMASDFKTNGGSSLRDAVDRIDAAAITAVTVSAAAHDEVVRLGTLVKETADTTDANNKLLHELKGAAIHMSPVPKVRQARRTSDPPDTNFRDES